TGQRHLVGELVLDLAAVLLLELVDDLRDGVVVRVAIVDVRLRQRDVGQHFQRDRVETLPRNDVVRELRARRRKRVVNLDLYAGGVGGRREIAVALGRRRQRQRAVARRDVVIVLGREPEERPVLHDRTADAATRDATPGGGLLG